MKKRIPRSGYSDKVPDWSVSKYWSFIRSGLRAKWVRYPPRYAALAAVKRPSQSDNKKLKWEFQCSSCSQWFPQKEVEVDHIEPAGSLTTYQDLPRFVENLFCSQDGLRVVCKPCHKIHTHGDKDVD